MATTVLLVDDNPEIVDPFSRFLAKKGYTVKTAMDAADGLSKLDGVDVVITDIMMPGLDGLSFAEMVKARQKIPVIAITAMHYTDLPDVAALAVDMILYKPIEPLDLAGVLLKLVAGVPLLLLPPR